MPGRLLLHPRPDASLRPFDAQTRTQSRGSDPSQRLTAPSALEQTHSKYIAFHGGGFLQVAVSEAPLRERADARCFAGRSRYSTKTSRSRCRSSFLERLKTFDQTPQPQAGGFCREMSQIECATHLPASKVDRHLANQRFMICSSLWSRAQQCHVGLLPLRPECGRSRTVFPTSC